ncbi:MAG: hypothetical protein ACOYL9_15025 [Ilumatobacteraceae bacterium]
MDHPVERRERPQKVRSFVVALLVSLGILVVGVPVAWYAWIFIDARNVAGRTSTFLKAWQAGDYELVDELLDDDCFQTAEDLRAVLGDSKITDFDVDRGPYAFGTVSRGSISFDTNDVRNFEFNFEREKLCGPVLWTQSPFG